MLVWHEGSDAGPLPASARARLSLEFIEVKGRNIHRHIISQS